jgi:hypothetical protein
MIHLETDEQYESLKALANLLLYLDIDKAPHWCLYDQVRAEYSEFHEHCNTCYQTLVACECRVSMYDDEASFE